MYFPVIENKFHHSTETEEILELKAKLKTFCFSQEAGIHPYMNTVVCTLMCFLLLSRRKRLVSFIQISFTS